MNIRVFAAFMIFCLIGAPGSALGKDFFPAGVWYGGGKARAPMAPRQAQEQRSEWKNDLKDIKSLGFNHIKCWVDWAGAEPRPGEYQFDSLRQLLDLCDETGLKAIVQIYADFAPEWVGDAFPDARFVTADGVAVPPQAAPGYCLDHPGVREAVANFISAAARTANEHGSFYAIDLWSEPQAANGAWFNPPKQFGFNPHTQAVFRQWLQVKYSGLDEVNQAWRRAFTRWDQVEAPRFGSVLSYADFIDWRMFIAEKPSRDLRMKVEAVRKVDPEILCVSHSDSSVTLKTARSGFGADDWLMAKTADRHGVSLYPKHAAFNAPWEPMKIMFSLDGIRSAANGNGWWIGEMQAGQGVAGVRAGAIVNAQDVRLWGWSAISRGAKALSYRAYYPMSGGHEANGYGLIQFDGTAADRAKAAGEFSDTVDRNAAILSSAKPVASQVAILYNPLASLAGGGAYATGNAARDSMMGMHRALFEENIQTDFIHPGEILAGSASRYRMIYLAYPLLLDSRVAAALKAYVSDGGVLVSEARTAWSDELGMANERIPGGGLDEVFGCVEKELASVEQTEMVAEVELPGSLAPIADTIFQGAHFEERLEPRSEQCQILARFANGDPAMTVHPYGKGQAMLIGTMLGGAYETSRSPQTGRMLKRIIYWAGVEPDVRIRGHEGAVEARLLESEDHYVFVGLNHTDAKQNVIFELPDDWNIEKAKNLETRQSLKLDAASGGSVFFHTFLERDALILSVKK